MAFYGPRSFTQSLSRQTLTNMPFIWVNLLFWISLALLGEGSSIPSDLSSHFKAVCGEGVAPPSVEAVDSFSKVTFFRCVVACLQESLCTGFTYIRNDESPAIRRKEGQCEMLHTQTTFACDDLPARPNSRYMTRQLQQLQQQPMCLNGGVWSSVNENCECSLPWTGEKCQVAVKDCTEIAELGTPGEFGKFLILPDNAPEPIEVFCYLHWEGFTYIHHIPDYDCAPRANFTRSWADYKKGFGNLDCDFWLGNDNIHYLTSQGKYRLDVTLILQPEPGHWPSYYQSYYENFRVGDEASGYVVSYDSYLADDAGDSFCPLAAPATCINGQKFSTYDVDNDLNPSANCASLYLGGWWHGADCSAANVNGLRVFTADGSRNTSVPSMKWDYDFAGRAVIGINLKVAQINSP